MAIIITENCSQCGICSDVCPMGIISQTDDMKPTVSEEKAQMCISCGQCDAFCPSGALIRDENLIIPSEKASQYGDISRDVLSRYIRSRRSIRNYRPVPVEKETIETILNISRYAASGGNGQPVEWLVIYNSEKVKEIAGLTIDWMKTLMDTNHPMSGYVPGLIAAWKQGADVICRGAPHLIIPHIPEGNPIAITDGIIALTHVDLVSPSFGVGTCWAGFVAMAASQYPPLQKMLNLPDGRKTAYVMMLGYPQYKPSAIPARKPLRITWND